MVYVASREDMMEELKNGLERARVDAKAKRPRGKGPRGKGPKVEGAQADVRQDLIYVPPLNFPLCDFIDSSGRLYNATISCNHTLPDKALQTMFDSLDLRDGEQLHFCWCIPEGQKISPAKVADKFKNKLCQYALWIPRGLNEEPERHSMPITLTSLRFENISENHGSKCRRSKRKR